MPEEDEEDMFTTHTWVDEASGYKVEAYNDDVDGTYKFYIYFPPAKTFSEEVFNKLRWCLDGYWDDPDLDHIGLNREIFYGEMRPTLPELKEWGARIVAQITLEVAQANCTCENKK